MQRWEKGQAIFHKKEYEKKKGKKRGRREKFEAANAYGSLRYVEREFDGQARHGFILEAKEAPGTLGHTEQEKHLPAEGLHKVRWKEESPLYAAGAPFGNQAFFFDVSVQERSRDFLECLKDMVRTQGHRTVKDTFGFLEQDSDRWQKAQLIGEGEGMQEKSLEEFEAFHRRMNELNSRIQQKEERERQMCGELQRMLDREKRKAGKAEKAAEERSKGEGEKIGKKESELSGYGDSRQRSFHRPGYEPNLPEWAKGMGNGMGAEEEGSGDGAEPEDLGEEVSEKESRF